MTTLWANFAASQVQEAPLSNAALALTMSGRLQDLPTVGGGDIVKLTIDPEGADTLSGSGTEIVYVTAYTSGGGTATISRGQETTTPRPHSQGVKIVNAITEQDLIDLRNALTLGGHLPAYFAAAADLATETTNRTNADSSEASTRASADSTEATNRASGDSSTLASANAHADSGDAARLQVLNVGSALAGGSPPTTGVMVQAGTLVTTLTGGSQWTVTFPSGFPNGLLYADAVSGDVVVFDDILVPDASSYSKTLFRGLAKGAPGAITIRINWIAVGW